MLDSTMIGLKFSQSLQGMVVIHLFQVAWILDMGRNDGFVSYKDGPRD